MSPGLKPELGQGQVHSPGPWLLFCFVLHSLPYSHHLIM